MTTIRRVFRRSALVGYAVATRWAGSGPWVRPPSGLVVLLMHSTRDSELRSLLRFVDKWRDYLIGFDEATNFLTGDRPIPNALTLTFDDGFQSNLAAARALAERGLRACFYIPTSIIGVDQAESDRRFGRPQDEPTLSWDQLCEMASLGHTIGSHAVDHVALTSWSLAEAELQVKESVALLRERLGAIHHFAWPFGGLSHAPVDDVIRWCREIDVLAASGVRGVNTAESLRSAGYLRRDAVDPRWIDIDVRAFTSHR